MCWPNWEIVHYQDQILRSQMGALIERLPKIFVPFESPQVIVHDLT